jgi:hypothetical protein
LIQFFKFFPLFHPARVIISYFHNKKSNTYHLQQKREGMLEDQLPMLWFPNVTT